MSRLRPASLGREEGGGGGGVGRKDAKRICSENPYIPSLRSSLNETARLADGWIERKNKILPGVLAESKGQMNHIRYNIFEEMGGGCNQSCVGGPCQSDVSKIVCGLQNLAPGCVVYSIGGNNQWQFERDILAKTPCEVHTFDCTGPRDRFQIPDDPRLHFHYTCLSAKPSPSRPVGECTDRNDRNVCGDMKTLSQIQSMFNHTQIDLLKMDIEGFEHGLFMSWGVLGDETEPLQVLPMQILVELHYRTGMKELAPHHRMDFLNEVDLWELQTHLLRMGYATIVRDNNRRCLACSELTILRFRCPLIS